MVHQQIDLFVQHYAYTWAYAWFKTCLYSTSTSRGYGGVGSTRGHPRIRDPVVRAMSSSPLQLRKTTNGWTSYLSKIVQVSFRPSRVTVCEPQKNKGSWYRTVEVASSRAVPGGKCSWDKAKVEPWMTRETAWSSAPKASIILDWHSWLGAPKNGCL